MAPSATLDEGDRGAQLQAEAAPGSWNQPNIGALLLQPTPEQQQAALEIVLELREVQGLVEAQLAIRELGAAGLAVSGEQFPENLRRQAANQVVAVDHEALVCLVV